jgi:hypothetical protein
MAKRRFSSRLASDEITTRGYRALTFAKCTTFMAAILIVDVSYEAPQAHRIVNVALHREYSLSIIFIFSQVRKYLYLV